MKRLAAKQANGRLNAWSGTWVALVVLLMHGLAAAAEPADLILRGGKVVTIDEQQPEAEAIAIHFERIAAVGTA